MKMIVESSVECEWSSLRYNLVAESCGSLVIASPAGMRVFIMKVQRLGQCLFAKFIVFPGAFNLDASRGIRVPSTF